MDEVIDKTKKLIDVLDSSDLIKNIEYYKNLVLEMPEVVSLIDKYNNSSLDYEKLAIKKDIYNVEEYKMYMMYYNELFYYVLDINRRFKNYTDTRGCRG